MQHKNDALYVEQILEAIDRILRYVEGGEEEFFSQSIVRDAVALNLIVIGEATKNVSEEAQRKVPGVPWKRIAGMRNRLTHAYAMTDPQIMWRVVADELPQLRTLIEGLRDKGTK